jgi:hypothetical protein
MPAAMRGGIVLGGLQGWHFWSSYQRERGELEMTPVIATTTWHRHEPTT